MILKYIIELGYGNGIITKWNITHELVMYNFSFPADITHNLTSLTPNTTYMWRVAAATVNGTGPLSKSSTSFITLQDGNVDSHGLVRVFLTQSVWCFAVS